MDDDGDRERGQASVELVALLPLLAVLGLGVWQAALAGHAWWATGVAARAAAREAAVSGSGDAARAAALRTLPRSLRPSALVAADGDGGAVRVAVRVPVVVPGTGSGSLGRVGSTARFEPQR